MEEKDLFTLSDISAITGLSLTTIRRYSANGRLPTIHFSKRTVRVLRSVIETILTNGLPEKDERKVK